MTTRTAERRRSIRFAAAYPVVVKNRRGVVIGRGRTSNISEGGVYVFLNCRRPPAEATLLLELTLPDAAADRGRHSRSRKVLYSVRMARYEPVGNLWGLGLAFIEKLA